MLRLLSHIMYLFLTIRISQKTTNTTGRGVEEWLRSKAKPADYQRYTGKADL